MMQEKIRKDLWISKIPKFILNIQIIMVCGMQSRVKSAGLLALLLILLSLHTGCISFGPAPKGDQGSLKSVQTGGGSIQDITSRSVPTGSLADTITTLPAALQEGSTGVNGMTITKIWGYGVDSGGLARTWVLGMWEGGKATLITRSEGEWKVLDLPITLPRDEVKIQELISPQDLYLRNVNTIGREMNRLKVGESDITLDRDTYQVTIHSEMESTTLSFNAKTGELIPSP